MVEILGWIGSAVIVLSLTQRNVVRLRQLNLIACIVLTVFNAMLGIPSMVALNAVLVAINGYHLWAEWRRRRSARDIGEEIIDVSEEARPGGLVRS
ncbi:hypothetical protein GCM10009808_24130 [Microbacterium sediminicola]|uniref:Inner membrane protein n=1 Tax=Microbacterium sediminicola TaxID=415210 RepID=A0ABP4UGS6_9MICO